jgi:hypothetical protein
LKYVDAQRNWQCMTKHYRRHSVVSATTRSLGSCATKRIGIGADTAAPAQEDGLLNRRQDHLPPPAGSAVYQTPTASDRRIADRASRRGALKGASYRIKHTAIESLPSVEVDRQADSTPLSTPAHFSTGRNCSTFDRSRHAPGHLLRFHQMNHGYGAACGQWPPCSGDENCC